MSGQQSSKDYEKARDRAREDAVRSGIMRGGANMTEVNKWIDKKTNEYMASFSTSSSTKKKSYVQDMETYMKHFESNNMY